MKIESTKIKQFLLSLTEQDFIYLKHVTDISKHCKLLIREHNISKADFCEKMHIKPRQYNDFIKGAYDYTLMDMARLNALHIQYASIAAAENPPFKIKWVEK